MAVTRDDVVNDRVRERLRADPTESQHLLSEAEFARTRAEMLSQFEDQDELWVFAYGSLIWNPTFCYDASSVATLHGYHRSFCLWANAGRGSHELPGLWLGLDDGHSCTGLGFRIPNEERDYESLMLWRREMVSGAYLPRRLPVDIGGTTRPTLCLLANKDHPRYAGTLSEAEVIRHIAHAEGQLGTCREYLYRLVDKLHSESIADTEIDALRQKVQAVAAD